MARHALQGTSTIADSLKSDAEPHGRLSVHRGSSPEGFVAPSMLVSRPRLTAKDGSGGVHSSIISTSNPRTARSFKTTTGLSEWRCLVYLKEPTYYVRPERALRKQNASEGSEVPTKYVSTYVRGLRLARRPYVRT